MPQGKHKAKKEKWAKLSGLLAFLKEVLRRYQGDNGAALGAEFAYNLLLAFLPFAVLVLRLAASTPLLSGEVLPTLLGGMPESARNMITAILAQLLSNDQGEIRSFILATALLAGSNGFVAVIRGLNRAYDVEETRGVLRVRSLSLLFTLLIALAVLLEMALVVFGNLLLGHLALRLGWTLLARALGGLLRLALPLATLSLVFSLLYLWLPNRKLRLGEVLPGAVFTACSWMLVSLLFSLYVDNFANYAHVYGSLGGVIVLMLWLRLLSALLLLGSQINAVRTLPRPFPTPGD